MAILHSFCLSAARAGTLALPRCDAHFAHAPAHQARPRRAAVSGAQGALGLRCLFWRYFRTLPRYSLSANACGRTTRRTVVNQVRSAGINIKRAACVRHQDGLRRFRLSCAHCACGIACTARIAAARFASRGRISVLHGRKRFIAASVSATRFCRGVSAAS